MEQKGRRKKEPWRIVVGLLAIGYIVYMWVKKDIVAIYTTVPTEELVPLIATTVLVSLVKVAAIAGGVLLIKWIISKMQK